METFNFPFHTERTEYPEDSKPIRFGGSYTFSTKPNGPPQRSFVLTFPGMIWYFNSNGTVDTTTNPSLNMGRLDAFYRTHRMFNTFTYPHPVYGNLTVRFETAFKHPERMKGGTGATDQFEIRLIEDMA